MSKLPILAALLIFTVAGGALGLLVVESLPPAPPKEAALAAAADVESLQPQPTEKPQTDGADHDDDGSIDERDVARPAIPTFAEDAEPNELHLPPPAANDSPPRQRLKIQRDLKTPSVVESPPRNRPDEYVAQANQALPGVSPEMLQQAQSLLNNNSSSGGGGLFDTLQQLLNQPRPVMPQPGGPNTSPSAADDDSPPNSAQGSSGPEPATVQIRRESDNLPAPALQSVGEGDDHLQMNVRGDIRDVLAGLSEQLGLNIIPTRAVQGNVSVSLSDVSAHQALDAILRSAGYASRREGNFIYVGTPEEFTALLQPPDKIGTRIYRPNYVTARELETLITPLISPEVGRIKATTASKTQIPTDSTDAGGNDYAGDEALLVQDFESVLLEIDQIVAEIDCRPLQVAIEAMILSVRLNDVNQRGIDWRFLVDQQTVRFGIGTPANALTDVTFDGGLTFAFLDSNLGVFLKALEQIGDTNVIATPRLMVLNKQRAEILIGAQLGYVNTIVTETAATQTVEFLDIGTQLRLRPFIASDGQIRMEIHPELSTGTVRVEQGITLPDKEVTSVTTNIMVQDGSTVVIGGLMREDLSTTATQVPLVGSLPVIGPLFRRKEERIEKREILVLVTPRIVSEPQLGVEGDQQAAEFHRRQSWYADKMSPIGKRYLGRKHLRLAQEAWAAGNRASAMRHINLSLHIDPESRAALDLRSDIVHGVRHGAHTLPPGLPPPRMAPPMNAPPLLDGEQLPEWLLDELEQAPPGGAIPGPAKMKIKPRPAPVNTSSKEKS